MMKPRNLDAHRAILASNATLSAEAAALGEIVRAAFPVCAPVIGLSDENRARVEAFNAACAEAGCGLMALRAK